MSEENIKVAVRVRPFNKREKARDAKLIVEMSGPTTKLIDPDDPGGDGRSFSFDYSYWSHDGFEPDKDGYLKGTNPNYADQRRVYDDVGKTVLNNAWDGYNSTLFAYGQTGSGKSWSIVGYGVNKGIVPIFCDELFKGIDQKKGEGSTDQYEVMFSMLEIYNEQVRDLLNPASNKKGGLKVRQHPKKGFYADGLKTVAVVSYEDIEQRMEDGTMNRTVAATQMNATSSRAHTVVGVTFIQKSKNAAGEETAKTSIINLVDLAGSERADSTGATGDRLKEGAAINQSLSALGNVISALVDKSNGKNVRVPYRDSVLTRLLKNALAGNSKTAMIAAISPADINFDETLSTLRYADRAKQIKTTATVNEDPTEKMIRELKEQNEKLLEKLKAAESGGKVKIDDDDDDDDDDGLSEEEMAKLRKEIEDDIRASMAESDKDMADMNRNWEDRVNESKMESRNKEEELKKRKAAFHLWNLNADPQLTGMIVHLLKEGQVKIGNKKADPPADITLVGLNIQMEHCVIAIAGGKATITPNGDAKVLVNGEPVTEPEELHHCDRIMFGSSHLYVFHHPNEAETSTINEPEISYEMAQEEIAANSGFGMDEGNSKDDMLLQGELVEVVPQVEEANAISQELDRKVSFEVVVVSAKARGQSEGRPEPCVAMKNLENGSEYLWPRTKFVNRKYLMEEMYNKYEDGEDWKLPDERDPFTESPGTEVMIGCVEVSMESLGYVLDMREQLNITNYKGESCGVMNVEIIPLDSKGNEINENSDIYIDNPQELVGKQLEFVVRIKNCRGIPKRFTDVYCSYSLYLEDNSQTKKISRTINPEFEYERKFSFNPVPQKFVDYLMKKSIIVQIWGQQVLEKKPVNKAAAEGKDTKAIMKAETAKKGMAKGSKKGGDRPQLMMIADVATMKKRKERLERKMEQLRNLCAQQEKNGHIAVEISKVRAILGEKNATAPPAAASGAGTGATHAQETHQSDANRRNESSTCSIL